MLYAIRAIWCQQNSYLRRNQRVLVSQKFERSWYLSFLVAIKNMNNFKWGFGGFLDTLFHVKIYYRPQRSCEGYVFTPVHLSTGGSASVHAGIPLGAGTPPGADCPSPSPGSRPPSRRVLLRTVRILLECILVEISITVRTGSNNRQVKLS